LYKTILFVLYLNTPRTTLCHPSSVSVGEEPCSLVLGHF